MAPRQMSAGARPHSPAPVIRPRPCHHRIERPHAPSAVARAIAARRQAILYHQLPNELLASRVQEDSNMNCLMILRGLPLDIHSDQPPLPTTCDEEMDWYFNSGAYRRDQTLAMHDGRHVVRSASYLVEPMPAAHRVLQPPPAINHQQAASISSFPSVHQVPTQSTIPVGAQFSPPHPSLSPSAAPALSNPLPRLTAHALGMLEPAYSPTLLSWSEESSLDSSESSLVDSAESSDNSADSALVPEVDNPNPARIVPGLRLQPKARKCFEHLHKKFSRAKREWIGSLHVQGFYLCTSRYDAPVGTANTPCAACVKRGKDLVKAWNNRFASVLTWIESTTSEKQEAHPQWEGTLGAIGHQMDVDLESAGED
ncbi:hypothetical protein B0H65DRAFT_436834 [Neurospora tetraspora]|uniref:Uncharacterized protein n=1 Tax=Neurospora tetraspora TaxID=94610 RepID=A0AAE0MK27_9PEZI|nr:hypothetical protein B0H65DRAFT_436834 [Neurospora tetraspora]